jgi:hypothetical protein
MVVVIVVMPVAITCDDANEKLFSIDTMRKKQIEFG